MEISKIKSLHEWDMSVERTQRMTKTINILSTFLYDFPKEVVMDTSTLGNNLFETKNYEARDYEIMPLLKKITGKENVYDILDIIATKDEKWIKERNKNYKFEWYIKYIYKPGYIKKIKKYISVKIKEIEQDISSEREAQKLFEDAHELKTFDHSCGETPGGDFVTMAVPKKK